jgi:polyphenol oxidase
MQDALHRPAIFDPLGDVFAAFTTRHFAGPSRTEAQAASARLAEEHGFYGVAFTEQVHGARVAAVDVPGIVPGHDGLVTRRDQLLLGTVAADCALVLMADPEARVAGTCHAGWRGAVAGIVANTIEQMIALGAEPGRIRAYVGPCISVEEFEVGEEVASEFPEVVVARRPEWPRPHVDLRGAVHEQLRQQGILEEHTQISEACTVRQPETYYSYRGQNGTTGRLLGLIGFRAPAS